MCARLRWAALIRRVYEVDPFAVLQMRRDDGNHLDVVRKIVDHFSPRAGSRSANGQR